MCLRVTDGRNWGQFTFKLRMKCGNNSNYSPSAPSDLASATSRYFEQFINNAQTVTFSNFNSGNIPTYACGFDKYEIWKTSSSMSGGVSGVSFANNQVKTVSISSSIATSLSKAEFYIVAKWSGGAYAVTGKITVQVVCGSETVSGATSINLESNDAPDSMTTTFDKSVYQLLTTNKAACPIVEWEVRSDGGGDSWTNGGNM